MKANRKFVRTDDAVSPVIAVILMVAITVVLAATVFVLVSDIGGNTGSTAPQISWNPDETQDRFTVNTAANNADWYRLTIQADSCTSVGAIVAGSTSSATYINKNVNAAATGADIANANCASPSAVRVGSGAARIIAGDYIDLCHDDTSGSTAATNVKVTIKDTTANSIVTSHTFTDVADCG